MVSVLMTSVIVDVVVLLVVVVLVSVEVVVVVESVIVLVESVVVVTPDVMVEVVVVTLENIRDFSLPIRTRIAIRSVGCHRNRLGRHGNAEVRRAKGRSLQILTCHLDQGLDNGAEQAWGSTRGLAFHATLETIIVLA